MSDSASFGRGISEIVRRQTACYPRASCPFPRVDYAFRPSNLHGLRVALLPDAHAQNRPVRPGVRRVTWRGTLTLIACLIAMSGSVACRATEPGVTDDAIRLGMVNAQTGAAEGLGRGLRMGAQAVFDDANARGGVHGRKIDLVVDDDRY
ncbi:ABC transporter substrate-binding protein, partial [Burkholderia ubonensis]|uniref:ABC transporter substrate-binding protein n=1 Tax=Burkholderia ubonensis TaxID=101571 RepID=UPI000AA7CA3E